MTKVRKFYKKTVEAAPKRPRIRIKKGDMVLVIAGKRSKSDYDGQPRRVLKVLPETGKIVVEGHKMMKKHIRPTKNNPKGGRIEKEASINLSNVMLYCPKCEAGVRISMKVEEVAKKRVCSKCEQEI